MAYIEGRLVHDADSHLMELYDCLDSYLTADELKRYRALPGYNAKLSRAEWMDRARKDHRDDGFRAEADDNIMLRKNYDAKGAFIPEDRPRVVDLLGVASQLIFTTHNLGNLGLDQSGDLDLCYSVARAHNQMMTEFCAVDRRLLATAYIPLEDIDRTIDTARQALDLGAKGLLIPSWCPQDHSPSHVGLDPLWAMAEEAGVPILFHVGFEEKMNPVYKENGLPPVPDFHGGDDNFTSISYMPIPNSAMQTLSTLIFDGVFDRFSNLKFGAIELGASWVPGWMRSLDSAAHAFMRNEERLQNLSAKPSEIVQRQLRVTPYPHEDAGWVIRNAGEQICMFSSDYPHIEGGRNPIKRFDSVLEGLPQSAIDAFYADNFIDMMGKALPADLKRPAHLVAAE
ncbi:amidohydrolase family protein [Henriciella litoralis]|uniref:amidohydrolase family protein n=1 Tax=Henriciella litoralis TaxID=568102 RepID=UPI000A0306A2|nr:amidohydrolase family protein [Henriciella litoralis]